MKHKPKLNRFIIINFIFITNITYAFNITEKGINNIGSMTAYIMSCEGDGYIKLGTVSDYVITIRKTFTKKDADAIMLVYQNSLHSKQIYSPSKNAWFTTKVDEKSCKDVEKSIPSLKDFYNKMSKEYPN
jgi:hypothetical protein